MRMMMSEGNGNGFAGKSELRALAKRRYTTVDVDGMTFRLQSFSEAERSRIECQRINDGTGRLYADGVARMRQLAIATALVDGDGNRIYSDEQAEELADIDSGYTEVLWDAINRHTDLGMSPRIEEAAKN